MLHEYLIKNEEEENLVAKNLPRPPAGTGTARSKASARLQSLDVLRGLTIALMILVDFCGDSSPSIDHSPWDGMCLADQVID
jgi:predicted acyltransferase